MSLKFNKATHQYFLNNQELFSVSKILENYLGTDYSKVPPLILQNAIVKGNAVHKIGELYFKNIAVNNIVSKIKTKIDSIFTTQILDYCYSLLEFLKAKFKDDRIYISEQMIGSGFVAGTPDLVFQTTIGDLYSIIDFKTYKIMTKKLLLKAELQITAYHWLLMKNGFHLANTHYLLWVKPNGVETISVKITKEKIQEWENAIEKFSFSLVESR